MIIIKKDISNDIIIENRTDFISYSYCIRKLLNHILTLQLLPNNILILQRYD